MTVLDDIQAKVGEEYGVGEWTPVAQSMIDGFADATGDYQWIHVDEARAAAGPFGQRIAHGFLTLSLIPAIAPAMSVPGVRMGINYGLDRVRFITPVPAGSNVRARASLIEAKEIAGGVQLKSEVTIELEGADKPACVAETLVRLYF